MFAAIMFAERKRQETRTVVCQSIRISPPEPPTANGAQCRSTNFQKILSARTKCQRVRIRKCKLKCVSAQVIDDKCDGNFDGVLSHVQCHLNADEVWLKTCQSFATRIRDRNPLRQPNPSQTSGGPTRRDVCTRGCSTADSTRRAATARLRRSTRTSRCELPASASH